MPRKRCRCAWSWPGWIWDDGIIWGSGVEPQFGGDYTRLRKFKEKFIQHLKVVLNFYPQAKVEATSTGLSLRPSKTHVPMRLVSTGKAKKQPKVLP